MNATQKQSWIRGLLILGVGLFGIGTANVWASNPIDATITVTPVATVDLAISPTTYAFGQLNVNTSSITASALTLSNNGNVNVACTKQITTQSNPAGWTAANIAGSGAVGLDTYALYVATAAARPLSTDFTVASHLFNGGSANNLNGLGGTQPIITPAAGALPNVSLWFRLDMPSAVSSQTGREVTVAFTATAQ